MATAFTLFAVLCGFALVLGHAPRGSVPARPSATRSIAQAIGELERVGQSLDATDYGQARVHLRRARATLTELLPRRKAGE